MGAIPDIPTSQMSALIQRITALETQVREATNKNLFSASIGKGGINVTGGSIDVNTGGVNKFHTGVDQTVIRDAAGNVVISDDPTAGWGFTQPNQSIPFYVTQSSTYYYPFSAGSSAINLPIYAGQAPVNNPKMNFKYEAILNTGSAATCTYTLFVTIGANTYTMDTITLTGTTTQTSVRSGTWSFPSDLFGQIANYNLVINFTNSGTVGVTAYSILPIYLYGSGV
jgi:hypothetical protein